MTLLLYFKPNYHQGHAPPADEYVPRLRKKRKKPTKKYIKNLAETLELEPTEVKEYVEDVLENEDVDSLIARVGEMVKKSLIAKRKRLNMLIASILDWL